MRTYTVLIPTEYAPNTCYLARYLLHRENVLDVVVESPCELTVICESATLQFSGYQEGDSWRWFCNVE